MRLLLSWNSHFAAAFPASQTSMCRHMQPVLMQQGREGGEGKERGLGWGHQGWERASFIRNSSSSYILSHSQPKATFLRLFSCTSKRVDTGLCRLIGEMKAYSKVRKQMLPYLAEASGTSPSAGYSMPSIGRAASVGF